MKRSKIILNAIKRRKYDQNKSLNEILVSIEKKYLYAACSKNACSKIKAVLSQVNGISLAQYQSPHIIDNIGVKLLSNTSFDEMEEILLSEEYFRFTFSRNPFDRAISCYLNRVADIGLEGYDNENISIKQHKKRISLINNCAHDDEKSPYRTPSFESFIHFICWQNEKAMDPHWAIQKYTLHPDIINYDFIGKIENFAIDMSRVIEKIDSEKISIDLTTKINDSKRHYDREQFFTPKLTKIFLQKYKIDFDTFGYSTNIND